jgi:hypothetical protein
MAQDHPTRTETNLNVTLVSAKWVTTTGTTPPLTELVLTFADAAVPTSKFEVTVSADRARTYTG